MEGYFYVKILKNKFKQEIVAFYLNTNGEYKITANYFNIPLFSTGKKVNKKISRTWLIRNQKTSYNREFKQNVLEYIIIVLRG